PDDIEFGCGGTLAKWAGRGCEVHHLVCTDGSKGSWEPDADLTQLVVTRQEEQREAARIVGASGEVVFLGWHDGELEAGLTQRRQFRSTMAIDDGAPADQLERFRRRVTDKATEQGRPAGVAHGESFRLLRDL